MYVDPCILATSSIYLSCCSQGKLPADWQVWTWNDFYRDSRAFAKTLIHLDVQPYHIVNILGFNSVSYSLSNLSLCQIQWKP